MMAKRTVEGVLHCRSAGAYHGRGGRERQPLVAEVLPAQGSQVVFSLAHACLARDLYRGPGAPRRPGPALAAVWVEGHAGSDDLKRWAGAQWGRSVPRFLEAAGLPASADALGSPPPTLPRALIGGALSALVSGAVRSPGTARAVRVCCDIGICVAALSRCAGTVYLRARTPDYEWDHLFESVLWADAPGVPYEDLALFTDPPGCAGGCLAWRCWREPGEAAP